MNKLRAEIIKYSKKLNITNLSALRSGNISVRVKEKNVDGFYITPSGREYGSLKPKEAKPTIDKEEKVIRANNKKDKNLFFNIIQLYNRIWKKKKLFG